MDNDYKSILARKGRWHRHSILLGKFFHHHCFLFHMMNSQTFSSANFIVHTNFFEVKHDSWVQAPLYLYFSTHHFMLVSETAPENINIHRFISVYKSICTPISIKCCCLLALFYFGSTIIIYIQSVGPLISFPVLSISYDFHYWTIIQIIWKKREKSSARC